MNSVSRSGWGDIQRYGKGSKRQQSSQERANTAAVTPSTPTVFDGESHLGTMEATVGNRAALVTLGTNGSSDGDDTSSNMCLGVVENKPDNFLSATGLEGEIKDRVMTMMRRQQESLADCSRSLLTSLWKIGCTWQRKRLRLTLAEPGEFRLLSGSVFEDLCMNGEEQNLVVFR